MFTFLVPPAGWDVRLGGVITDVSVLWNMREWILLRRGLDDAKRDGLPRWKLLSEWDDRHKHAAVSSRLCVSRWDWWQRDDFAVRGRKIQHGRPGRLSAVSRWHDRTEHRAVLVHDVMPCRCCCNAVF